MRNCSITLKIFICETTNSLVIKLVHSGKEQIITLQNSHKW